MIRRLNASRNELHLPFQTPKVIREPLTEIEILDLQDAFLTNGVHIIKVKNVAAGRNLVAVFLESLHCYHDTAMLTVSDVPLEKSVVNLYEVLIQNGYLDNLDLPDLEEFFLEKFYFDFVWLEATEELIANRWFAEFETKLTDLKINNHIPIVFLTYESE